MQINIEKNQKEIKHHGDYSFPVHVSEESITRYEGDTFLWHWHPEIELTWVQSGQITYQVNENQYLLKAGDGLFGSCNALHTGHMVDDMDCEYLSITFHPRFLYGYEDSTLQTKYVDFIISNTDWSSLKLSPDVPWQQEVIKKMQYIYKVSKEKQDDMELEMHIVLCQIWQKLYQYYASLPEIRPQTGEHLERLKSILSYIKKHYSEPISLDDIANHVSICKSECCRFFKKHMNMTLFEYLMLFRIQQSLPLLKSGESITKISGMVGFSDSCYYGKIFKRYMNCSPSQYKKMQKN